MLPGLDRVEIDSRRCWGAGLVPAIPDDRMLPGIQFLGDESTHLLAEDVVDHHGREGRGLEGETDRRLGVERIGEVLAERKGLRHLLVRIKPGIRRRIPQGRKIDDNICIIVAELAGIERPTVIVILRPERVDPWHVGWDGVVVDVPGGAVGERAVAVIR